ncbi:MAG: glycosyltransferase family 2 protein [Thermodesulfobacteriota bacterium]
MSNKVDLSIIIVNWNSAEDTLRCVRSIKEETKSTSYEIIVVDNGSFDGCGERLGKEHPDVVYIQSTENLGFARGNNLGASRARGKAILFLNPDTIILDGAIDRLYRHLWDLPHCGILGCRVLNGDGSFQESCVQAFPTLVNQVLDSTFLRRLFPKSPFWGQGNIGSASNPVAEVEVVSGACMVVTRDVFEKVGGFSEDYFMYGEDVDLCYRVSKQGFRNYHAHHVEIIHYGGKSSGKRQTSFPAVMMRESISRYFMNNHGKLSELMYRFAMAASGIVRMAVLASFAPALCLIGKYSLLGNSLSKWFWICRWAMGLDGWTKSSINPSRTSPAR